jgi:NinB protein
MKQVFIMAHQEARRRALEAVAAAPDGYSVTIKEPTRNLDQNAVLWVLLERFSEQLKWPVNGVMTKLEPEEWKTLTTAAFQRETVRVAQGLDGGMVMLGMRTSKMSKRQFSEYLDFLHATAAQRGVEM